VRQEGDRRKLLKGGRGYGSGRPTSNLFERRKKEFCQGELLGKKFEDCKILETVGGESSLNDS